MKKIPALRALRVLSWVKDKRLKVTFIDTGSPVMIVLQGRRYYHTWLEFDKKKNVVKQSHKQIYLRKGIFLVLIWQDVPDWEITYRLVRGENLHDAGICKFDNKYCRLAYMRVTDLDHAFRQPLHVLDTYFNMCKPYPRDFLDRFMEILRIGRITLKIADRFRKIRSFQSRFKNNLQRVINQLKELIDDDNLAIDAHAKANSIRRVKNIIEFCHAIHFLPVYRRLYYASLSLKKAIDYINNDNLDRAKARMRSALKNLEYPEPS